MACCSFLRASLSLRNCSFNVTFLKTLCCLFRFFFVLRLSSTEWRLGASSAAYDLHILHVDDLYWGWVGLDGSPNNSELMLELMLSESSLAIALRRLYASTYESPFVLSYQKN